MTDRRSILKGGVAGAGAAIAAGATPAAAQTGGAPIKWRMTSSYPKALDAVFGAGDIFAKAVSDMTGGRIQLQHFAAGEVVPGLQALDAVQNGTVECCDTAAFYYIGKDPSFAFGAAVPFGLNTRQQNAWFFQGGGLALFNELLAQYNVVGLPIGNTNAQMAGWFRKEIKTVDDLKGLKMRIGGLAGQVIAKLGAVPQQIAAGDIYPALERGTIDAAEWVGPYDDEKLGFYKIAPFYYYPGWWEGGLTLHFFINTDKWAELPDNYKAIVTAAAAAANVDMLAKYDAKNPKAIQSLVSSGTQLRPFSTEIMQAAYAAAHELYGEISATNADFKTLIDSIIAFRDQEYLWFQVAEYSYDSFMIRGRKK